MTTQVSPTSPQVLQTYTLLQIAAEAFLGRNPADSAAAPGGQFNIDWDAAALERGNDHSSRMTQKQAEQFAAEWDVVSHQPNTATGFSATLFRCKVTDAARGMTAGQLVVSFRSTEFIEDHARDNHATNQFEVAQAGWAFGQLSDLQTWWASAGVGTTIKPAGGDLGTTALQKFAQARQQGANEWPVAERWCESQLAWCPTGVALARRGGCARAPCF